MRRLADWPVWLAAVLLAVAVYASRGLELVRGVELKTLDARFLHLARPERHDPRIVLVALDQASLDHLEKVDSVYWPWPRGVYEAALRFLQKAGAKAVVFDMLYTSPSSFGAADDQSFADALKSSRSVLAIETSGDDQELQRTPPPERFAAAEGTAGPAARHRASVRLPVAALAASVPLVGDSAAVPDPDGVVRRVPLFFEMGGRIYPTLPTASAMAALGPGSVAYSSGAVVIGGRRVPLDAEGRFLVDFHGSALNLNLRMPTYPAYSIKNLIEGWNSILAGKNPELDPALFKDKIVFVAGTAPGILDNRPSPISPVYPGTEIVATAADNLLNGDFLEKARPSRAFLLILLASLVGCACVRLAETGTASAVGAALASAGLAAAAAAAFRSGVWLDIVAPQLALWLAYAGTAAHSYATEGAQKRYIQGAFGRYLSPEIVGQIAADPSKLSLGGERREVTTYFSDIEGFTTISESLEPERLSSLMRRYLGEMTDTILESGGTLDKYIGDAVMAFWGAPIPRSDHALAACKVAVANQKKLAELRKQFEKEGFPPVRTRIGLNSGPASIGNMGSDRRFSYTAIGDNVNLASRLEGANKAYHSYILISESTREGAGDAIEVRELDFVKVKGKNRPIRVYELLGLKGETPPGLLEKARAFEKALELYRARRWDEAAREFERVDRELGPDGACGAYVERCAVWKANPPGADWDGSFALTEK